MRYAPTWTLPQPGSKFGGDNLDGGASGDHRAVNHDMSRQHTGNKQGKIHRTLKSLILLNIDGFTMQIKTDSGKKIIHVDK